MKILIGIDGSPHSDRTVTEVAKRPWPKNSLIRVLSVMEMPTLELMGIPPVSLEEWIESIRSGAQAAVAEAADKLKQALRNYAQVSGDVMSGSPKHIIIQEADRWGADLIIVGSHGHGVWESLLLGSVSQSVVLHANCSVEVSRSRRTATQSSLESDGETGPSYDKPGHIVENRRMKILLAVDGSSQSDAAVSEVVNRPWPERSTIRVITVLQNLPLGLIGLPATYFQDLTNPMEAHARCALDAATARLIEVFGRSVDVYGDLRKGSPKRIILEEANRWGADLIIVGAHGHNMLENFLLGSLPMSLVLHAGCSVEVVRKRRLSTQ